MVGSGATEICASGKCACMAPEVSCNGACTDTSKDPKNCGMCGNACPGKPNGTAVCLGGNLYGANPDSRFAARALGTTWIPCRSYS